MIFPKTWKKYGEVYSNERREFIYVCAICLENVEHLYFAFTTRDASEFGKHIQQHITADGEIPKEPPAKKHRTEIQPQQNNKDENNAESTVAKVLNSLTLLETFHESIVGNLAKCDEITADTETKEPDEVDVKIESDIELDDYVLEAQTKPVVFENKDVSKEKCTANNASSKNYICDSEVLTIPDEDEDDIGDVNKEVKSSIVRENSSNRVLFHNDMIVVSDDEDQDEVITRPNSPHLTKEVHEHNIEELTEVQEHNVEELTEVANKNSFNSGNSYSCFQCQLSFSNRNEFIDHLTAHEIEENSQQIEPSSSYPTHSVDCIPTPAVSPNDILDIPNVATNLKPYQCTSCPQQFCEEWQLNRHNLIHFSKRKSCKKQTNAEKTMNSPQHLESDTETTQCQICQKQYLSRNLQNHMMSHFKSKTKDFKCNRCGKRTCSKETMIIHERRFHNSEYEDPDTRDCQLCHKRVLKINFKQHLWSHSQLRYKCDHCDHTYKHRQTLRNHIQKCHPNAKMSRNPQILNCTANSVQIQQQPSQLAEENENSGSSTNPPLLGALQVPQPQLTPEEQQHMYNLFLNFESQNIRNEEHNLS